MFQKKHAVQTKIAIGDRFLVYNIIFLEEADIYIKIINFEI